MSITQRPHSALALAVHLALAALCTGMGSAVAASATYEQTRSYDIAPGPLTETLGQFASAAGVTLSFDGTSTGGRRSAGLQGSYSVASGFATLLAGSDLQAVRQANGVYLLVAGGQEGGAVVLGTTSINGQALGTTTEGTGSYTTGALQSATKLPLSIRETLQSVTVITRQRMDDQSMRSLDDVVQATPGLRMSAARPANSEYFSRGFPITNLMFDGLPTTYNADWVAAADMAPYDRVEIVRGATGMMQGAGNPSAAINMVRKRPPSTSRAASPARPAAGTTTAANWTSVARSTTAPACVAVSWAPTTTGTATRTMLVVNVACSMASPSST